MLLAERAGTGKDIAVLTMNRPAARNALNPELREALSEALRSADADPAVRVVILTGAGPVLREGRWGTAEEVRTVFGSSDAREGAIAFAERRQPRWTGQ